MWNCFRLLIYIYILYNIHVSVVVLTVHVSSLSTHTKTPLPPKRVFFEKTTILSLRISFIFYETRRNIRVSFMIHTSPTIMWRVDGEHMPTLEERKGGSIIYTFIYIVEECIFVSCISYNVVCREWLGVTPQWDGSKCFVGTTTKISM